MKGSANMNYYHFTTWEPADINGVLQARIPQAMKAANEGDPAPLKALYHEGVSIELLQHGTYKLGGWAFNLREYCKRYVVKVRHYGWQEYYALDKTSIYATIGRHNVIEVLEAPTK
jgi:hypothetical protein